MAQTSMGAAKGVAAKFGMSLEDYLQRNVSEKWCTGCKQWHVRGAFGADSSRSDGLASQCLAWRKRHYDATHVRTGRRPRAGIYLAPTRDGDKKQARARVNHAVDVKRIPDPNELPCADCGHAYRDGERHEYDHYLGYAAEHQMSVQAVCIPCHKAREMARDRAANKLPVNAQFSLEQVRAIRASDDTTRALAAVFGVDTETIRLIRNGKTYRSVA